MGKLTKSQKYLLWGADALVGSTFLYIVYGLIQQKSTGDMWIAYVLMMMGVIMAIVAMFEGKSKPKNIFLITSIIYASYSLVLAGITIKENTWEPFVLQTLVAVLALIGINIAAFKPDDEKAFNAINIVATVAGLVVVGFGVYENELSHSKIYSMMGAFLISLASISSSLSVLGVGK